MECISFIRQQKSLHIFTGVLGVHCILLESVVSFSRTYRLVFCVSVAIKKIIFESTLANSKPEIRNSLLYGFYYFAHTKIIT